MKINSKKKPFLIAEIGGNHEGDFGYALKLTELAIESNVDAIKYQIYSGDSLVNPIESPDRYSHFKKFELSKNEHIQLAELCLRNNVQYSASVWDLSVLDWIDPYLSFYKIGSGDLTTYELLSAFAKRGKPIVLSTGLSDLTEVVDAVNFLKKENKIYEEIEYLSILQCTSLYPNNYEDVNLNVIKTFKNTFDYPVGYSDHTKGLLALKTAYTMGAEILEFHFTDSREGKKFRDHHISLTKDEVHKLIKCLSDIDKLQGNFEKMLLTQEKSTNHIKSFRRAVYASRNIKSGTTIREEDLVSLRPNNGLDARKFFCLIGKKANTNINKLSKLSMDMFD
jgi:N,N'-diacetyllegionaminate synthase